MIYAIVVPLSQAQRQMIFTTVCEDNLRQIAATAAKYGTIYDDWIIGSPNTSGAYLLNATIAYGPAVQVWDWMGVMQYMSDGVSPPPPGNGPAVINRFNALRSA